MHVRFNDTEVLDLLPRKYGLSSDLSCTSHKKKNYTSSDDILVCCCSVTVAVCIGYMILSVYTYPDFLSKVKDTAEKVGQNLQERVESAGLAPPSPRTQRRGGPDESGSSGKRPPRPPPPKLGQPEPRLSLTLQTAQLFMSLLHAWGLQPDLDKLCVSKLGLMQPKRPITFGLLSRGGHMSLLMPGWHKHLPKVGLVLVYFTRNIKFDSHVTHLDTFST